MSVKKLLLAISIIGVMAIIAISSTSAFLSDTESSTDNDFTAGAIDLKVDNQSHYNGMVCQDGVWTESCNIKGENLIQNSGFEKPAVATPQNWDIYPSGNSDLAWSVEWIGSETTYNSTTRPQPALLELQAGVNGWLPVKGEQYAELDSDWDGPQGALNGEPALVKIYQDIVTSPGYKYRLSFKFSPRPGLGAADNNLQVKWDGSQIADLALDGATNSNTDWHYYEYDVPATFTTTRVEFIGGGTDNSLGVFVDEVKLYALDCRSNKMVDQSCDGTWELTDLGPTYKFFNLTDVKPADHGESTISLHVDTNEAYACLITSNLRNDDLGLTGPETVVDSTDGPDNGELAQHVYFLAWYDDGNNIWEEGEDLITPEPTLAGEFLDNVAYPLYTPANGQTLPADQTTYIGIAWCAGTMVMNPDTQAIDCTGEGMGNESQTDKLAADISFYVEQARHNESFVCNPPEKRPKLIVIKHVINDDGGIKEAKDFIMQVTGTNVSQSSFLGSESGVTVLLDPGEYSVDEIGFTEYAKTLGDDCIGTIAVGETKTCTITNDDEAQCLDFETKSKGYWINHPSQWILPQTLGSEMISTTFQAQEVFVRYSDTMRNKVRGQLLALKFNIAYYGAGEALAPGETITLAALASQADALLQATPPPADSILEAMKNRLENANNNQQVSTCEKKCALKISKTVDRQTANSGDTLTYTINFKNIGKADCTGGGVKLRDVVDSRLTFVNAQNSSNVSPGYNGSLLFTPDTSTLLWNANVLNPDESGWVTWKAIVNSPIGCQNYNIANTANISSLEYNWAWVDSNTVYTNISLRCQ
ncbi:MAG: SipW-dependent-type signal peptide-containing protein [Patescibacteria group bacterium]